MSEKRGYWQVEGDLSEEEATLAVASVIEAEAQGKSLIVVDGVTLRWVPPPGSLDAARAETEAALPEGLRSQLGVVWEPGLTGHAWAEDVVEMRTLAEADGPTPAAALRALTVKLREVGR